MKKIGLLLLLSTVTTSAAASDTHSYAEPDKFLVRHVALDLTASFEQHRLQGTAELTVEQRDPAAQTLTLDTRALEIESVHLVEASGREKVLAFRLDDPDPVLGSRLSIQFPHCCAATPEMHIRIAYRTSSEANALQWLDPEQTFGTKPFVYSQGEAIRTRSWIPLQDSPAVRVTYGAKLRVPPDLVAVMSAARVEQAGDAPGVFRFEMRQPIPSYLIAFAIGDLKFHAFSDRTGAWTESSRIAAAAHEFEDLPRMLAAGEKIAGPYRWDRYDVLIMPRSFPYGGMENPRLSFISPSVVAGDRSLVSTVVHELAHSWSGNLVTMSSWNDFWLNEGFTSYLERRLSEEIYGKRFVDMEDVISHGELVQLIGDMKASGHEKDSDLKLDLAGRDPDEGSTDIAYEKGRWFLGFLEGRYGRPAFDVFLRGWFDAHAFQSVDTETFRAWLLKDLARPGAPKITAGEIDAWLYGSGLPATMPALPTDVFDALDRTAKDWREGRISTASLPAKEWVPMEWVRFLNEQPADLPDAKLAELRSAYHLGADGNAEIALAWLQLVIRTAYSPAYGDLDRYLTQTGRWRLVSTLFTDLARTPDGLELGRAIYAKAKPGYHPSIRDEVERVLKLKAVVEADQ
jgi:aminopeptidase N